MTAQPTPITPITFDQLTLSPATQAALASMQIVDPTPIQSGTLPLLLAGRDVIGQARTGSGKTLAFGIPLVERSRAGRGAAQALILAPTRELASQVGGVVARLAQGHRLRVVELVGGRSLVPQTAALRSGAEIVIGTPGRVLDHLKQGTLRLDRLGYFVLDEADEMLDRGFGPDVERIIGHMGTSAGTRRQNALFSATVPEWVHQVASRLLHDPAEVRVDTGKPAAASAEGIEHLIYEVPEGAKPAVLRALLRESTAREGTADDSGGSTLVFGRTKHGVRKLATQLGNEGFRAAALQANLSQNARDRVIADFRRGAVPILVATNVAARGLDVAGLDRVINYDLPENGALFTHRVGRTGRMGRSGQAITLLAPEDQSKWRQLEKELKAAGLAKPLPRQTWNGPLPAVPASAASESAPPARPAQRGGAPRHASTGTGRSGGAPRYAGAGANRSGASSASSAEYGRSDSRGTGTSTATRPRRPGQGRYGGGNRGGNWGNASARSGGARTEDRGNESW